MFDWLWWMLLGKCMEVAPGDPDSIGYIQFLSISDQEVGDYLVV